MHKLLGTMFGTGQNRELCINCWDKEFRTSLKMCLLTFSWNKTFYNLEQFYCRSGMEKFNCLFTRPFEKSIMQAASRVFVQPDPMKHFGVMAHELSKIAKINLVHSVT